MPDNVARSIMGAHGEANKQHADFVAHRFQSTAVAFHAPIKINEIHLPGNRHKYRNKSKHVNSTRDDILTTNLAAVVCVCVDVCQCAQFDQFLPARSHFESKRREKFSSHSKIPIRCLWTAFCVPLSCIFYEKQ